MTGPGHEVPQNGDVIARSETQVSPLDLVRRARETLIKAGLGFDSVSFRKKDGSRDDWVVELTDDSLEVEIFQGFAAKYLYSASVDPSGFSFMDYGNDNNDREGPEAAPIVEEAVGRALNLLIGN